MNSIKNIIDHVRNRSYMSGVEREQARVKATGEVFTPTKLVHKLLDNLDQTMFEDPSKTFVDPTCGDGQFLGEVLIRKLENGIDFETALSTIYGVDIMEDNIELCRQRLLCNRKDLQHIVDKNIVYADARKYHFRFDNSEPYDDIAYQKRIKNLFDIG